MRDRFKIDKLINMGQKITASQLVALAIIIVLAIGYRFLSFGKVPLSGYDEAIYGLFIKTLGQKGIAGLQILIQNFTLDPVLIKGPLPFRILYIYSGFWCWKIFGGDILVNLAWISFVSGIGTIIIGYLLLEKWFNPAIAFWTAILLIVSPLGTALSRRALQDNLFTFIVTASIYCYHLCWQRKKAVNYIIWGLILLAGLLTKESMLFLYPCYGLLGLYYWRKTSYKFHWQLLLPLIIAPLIYLAISIWVAGSISLYIDTYLAYSKIQKTIEYAAKFQQGPWFRYIIDLLLISPLTYLLALFGAVNLSKNPNNNNDGRNLSLIYIISTLVVFSFMPIINVRFILFLDIPLRALAVLGIFFFTNNIKSTNLRYLAAGILIITVLAVDIIQFYNIFIKANVYDPVTAILIQANGLVR